MKIVYFLAALVFAPIASHAGTFVPPKGCSAYLTVQMKSCEVSHYWTCGADPEGNHWIMSIDGEGPSFLQYLDREFRWLQSYPQGVDISRELITEESDANSMTELFETRRDDFDFRQSVKQSGKQIAVEHITGFDRLNGTRVTIDGEPLLVTEFEIYVQSDNGTAVVHTTGNQFVSERFRLFFQGRETETAGGETFHYDDTPVLFIEPGEAGFLADRPEFGCDDMMSGLDQSLTNDLERQDDQI